MTTNTPWTPGPWFADGHYICSAEPDIYARQLAVTYDDGITGISERLANAQLIALAPEMADALAECITEEGAAAFLKREYAEKRLRYITEIAHFILARLPQKGGEK